MSKDWSVYIVECADGTYYTGISTDVKKRIEQHNSGKGAKYINARRRPVKFLIEAHGYTKSQALSIEHRCKQLKKSQKVNFLLEGGFKWLREQSK